MKIDLMCESYKRAADNRRMVRLKQNTEGYIWVEFALRGWPHKKPLPYWIPQGNIPAIHKNKYQGMSESAYLHSLGMHEIDKFNK